jgi:hypothetical protein
MRILKHLKRNEVHYTLALAVLSIVVSLSSCIATLQQTAIARQTLSDQQQKDVLQKSGDWAELKKALDLLLNMSPPGRYAQFAKWLSVEEREQWRTKVEQVLDSQSRNPVLLADPEALAQWRKATDAVRLFLTNKQLRDDDQSFTDLASNVQEDVFIVWKRLVWHSPQQPEFLNKSVRRP